MKINWNNIYVFMAIGWLGSWLFYSVDNILGMTSLFVFSCYGLIFMNILFVRWWKDYCSDLFDSFNYNKFIQKRRNKKNGTTD